MLCTDGIWDQPRPPARSWCLSPVLLREDKRNFLKFIYKKMQFFVILSTTRDVAALSESIKKWNTLARGSSDVVLLALHLHGNHLLVWDGLLVDSGSMTSYNDDDRSTLSASRVCSALVVLHQDVVSLSDREILVFCSAFQLALPLWFGVA